MLNSIRISNFRLFRHIEVRRLGRVNLIVGKNNSGKSAFLEAIELFVSNAAASVVIDLIESRQEAWMSREQTHSRDPFASSVRHLFYGHQLPDLAGTGIVLGELDTQSELHITTGAYRNESEPDGTLKQIRMMDITPEEDLSSIQFALIVEGNDRTRRVLPLNSRSDFAIRSASLLTRRHGEFQYPWEVVPTGNISDKRIASLWDFISLTDQESNVIRALQLIEPRVVGVAFVENNQGSARADRIPLVRIDGIKEPLPLKSMGDGMTRIFHIIVALVNAQHGILLVDEFENGLHWSVQPLVWKMIFRIAQDLDVQVFATTHSRDCIAGFDSAWNENEGLGAFFRLEAREGRVDVTEYTSDTLTDSIDMDVEIR